VRFTGFKEQLNSERAAAYLLCGDDPGVIRLALSFLTETVTVLPEFNTSYLSGGASAQDITEACELLPMGAPFRLVIARDFAPKGDDTARLNAYLARPNPACTLALVCADGADGLKGAETVDCNRIDQNMLSRWVRREGAKAGTDIAPAAADLLCNYCSCLMLRVGTEVEKLAAYGKRITADDVRELVEPDTEYVIYRIADSIARGDCEGALRAAEGCIRNKQQPSALLSAAYSHFRRLLYCAVSRDEQTVLASRLGVKPYAAQMSVRQARSFTPARLYRIVKLFCDAELNIKSGAMKDYNALILIINAVCKGLG
jgi:DNA polymerase III delta subunit